jgi:hypothetical protein
VQTGKFIDKRFGERDNLSEPEKNDMRFHHERLRQTRSQFSIDPAEESLTHLGMRLGEPAAGANTLQDDLFFQVGEDEDFGGRGGLLDEQAVQSLHFGGGEGDGGAARKKTKREIMDEIVAKSKQHKAERRQENQEQMELLQQVDAAFKEITPFLTLKKKPEKKKQPQQQQPEEHNQQKRKKKRGEEQQDEEDEEAAAAGTGRAHEEGYEADEYDQLVTELRATSRDAKAADRMQSREEEARLRLERLKALEVMRERRMQGVAVGPGEEDDAQQGKASGGKKAERLLLEELKKRVAAGKGNDDDEDDDDDDGDGDDGDDSDGNDEGDDNEEGGKGSKKSNRKLKRRLRAKLRGALKKELHDRGDWVIQKRWKRDLLEDESAAAQHEADSHKVLVDANTGEEFPFVLEVPASFDAFCALMRGNSPSVCGAVLDRMLHSNDPLLDPGHGGRLRLLHVYLLGYALRLSSPMTRESYEWIEMAFSVVRRLVLMVPSSDSDLLAAHSSVWFPYRVLLNVLAGAEPLVPARPGEDPALFAPLLPRLEEAGRRRAAAAAQQARVAYTEGGFPAAPVVLVLLQLSRLFSASDRLHPVWTPVLVHLLSVLATAVPRTAAHLRLLCLLSEGLLPVLADARTFAAEPAAFLASLGALLAAPAAGPPPALSRHPHWPAIALDAAERDDLRRLCNGAAGRCAEWLLTLGPSARPLVQALLDAPAVPPEARPELARRAAALTLPPLRLCEKRMEELEQV